MIEGIPCVPYLFAATVFDLLATLPCGLVLHACARALSLIAHYISLQPSGP